MGVIIIRNPATQSEISEMSVEFGSFIKLAVDLERAILAGGGEYTQIVSKRCSTMGASRETSGAAIGCLVSEKSSLNL